MVVTYIREMLKKAIVQSGDGLFLCCYPPPYVITTPNTL